MAAAATVLFAPAAIFALATTGAPGWTFAPPALAALPLIALAAAAMVRPVSPTWFAAAQLPILAAAGWLAWASGGVLSPTAPWAFAAFAALIALGGGRLVFWSALGVGAAIAAALWLGPAPTAALIGYAPRVDREAAAIVSWAGAGLAVAATVWAAHAAWISALPALRHPTIAARRALGALADDAGVAAVRLDADGVAQDVVGSSAEAFGMPAQDLLGVQLAMLAHPDDQAALGALLAGAPPLADAAASVGAETRDGLDRREGLDPREGLEAKGRGAAGATAFLRLRSRFGGFRWVEAALAPAPSYPSARRSRRAAAGAAGERVVVLRARRRRDEGGRADPDKAGLLAHVHDGLRRELSAVVGYSDMLKNEIFGPLGADRYREYARLTHDGGAHLLELVDELLELAAVDAGRIGADPALIDPIPVIEGAARLAKRRAERRGVALEADAPPSTPHLRTDRRALRRVLINLYVDTARRCSVGDAVALRVETEPDAISFKFYARRAPGLGGLGGALGGGLGGGPGAAFEPDAARPALIAGPAASDADAAAQADDEAAAESDADGVTERGEARLGRLVAISLAERLGGGLLFADGENAFDRLSDAGADDTRLVVEAIFPIGSASRLAADARSAEARPADLAEARTDADEPARQRRAGSAARPPAPPPAPRPVAPAPRPASQRDGTAARRDAVSEAPAEAARRTFELVVDAEIVVGAPGAARGLDAASAGPEPAPGAGPAAIMSGPEPTRAVEDDPDEGPLFGASPPNTKTSR